MSLITRIRNAFTREAPRALRNKAGGMAHVRPPMDARTRNGVRALTGCPVTTLRLNAHGNWVIKPELTFIATRDFTSRGELHRAGDTVAVLGFPDDWLEPWKDDGVTDKEVAELYAPNRTKEPV